MVASIKPNRDEVGLADGLMLIDGRWTAAEGGQTWGHRHPATGEDVASFPVAGPGDVDLAARAARRAFDEGPWPRARATERIRVLRRIADLVREYGDELLKLQALDNSVPLSFGGVYGMSSAMVADVFDHHAGWVDKLAGETLPPYQGGDHLVMTLREPVGVVGAIVPWNAPLLLAAQKLAPALAAGCTIVVKPSEYATFAVLRLAGLIEEAGLPPGVLNVVTGPGDPTGEALITHPMVNKLSFTGSRAVGRRIVEASADGFKRVSLELGGKSPAVVFADADVSSAAAITMGTVTLGLSGQVCLAQTRALVHRDVADEFLSMAEMIGGMVSYGNPFDPAVTSSPLINTKQLDRVLGLIAQGQADGARLVCGGTRGEGRSGCRQLRRAHAVHRRDQRHEHRQGGDLRPGALGDPVQRRGRGGADRQRHPVRARRHGLDQRHQARDADDQGDQGRHRRHQRLPARAARRVRRLPPVRPRPRGRPRRDRGLHRAQDRPAPVHRRDDVTSSLPLMARIPVPRTACGDLA